MASRFGQSGLFTYQPGDTLDSPTGTVYLGPHQMPQFPFETTSLTDRVSYRSKSGRKFSFHNYNLRQFTFYWTMLDQTMRDSLKTMYDTNPIMSFSSAGQDFGTFRFGDDTWKDSEALSELFDVSFSVEETV